jgi:hypothetical protein
VSTPGQRFLSEPERVYSTRTGMPSGVARSNLSLFGVRLVSSGAATASRQLPKSGPNVFEAPRSSVIHVYARPRSG